MPLFLEESSDNRADDVEQREVRLLSSMRTWQLLLTQKTSYDSSRLQM